MYRAYSLTFVLILLTSCSPVPGKTARIYGTGDKASVGKLLYSVVDTQFAPALGDAGPAQRTPQNRFVMVQLSISNSGEEEVPIPGMTLIDDSGKVYQELADGTGVPRWLGIFRKVGPNQTEEGVALFDAPAKHFKLRLTEDTDEDVEIDVPLSFIHEMQGHEMRLSGEPPSGINVPGK